MRTIELPLAAVVGIIEAMIFWHERAQFEGWTPTADNINELPDPLRNYVYYLETNADPAGMVAENTLLKDQTLQLDAMIGRLKMAQKNTFDKIEDAQIHLENGITELERDYGSPHHDDLQDQMNRALTDLRAARRILREVQDG